MQTINFIISEQDPDGRTCKVSETPIAIFQGESKEEVQSTSYASSPNIWLTATTPSSPRRKRWQQNMKTQSRKS